MNNDEIQLLTKIRIERYSKKERERECNNKIKKTTTTPKTRKEDDIKKKKKKL